MGAAGGQGCLQKLTKWCLQQEGMLPPFMTEGKKNFHCIRCGLRNLYYRV